MPAVYTSLERELTAAAAARQAPLRLAHYRREGWTFHAKGLWLWPPAGGTAAPPAGGGAAPLAGGAAAVLPADAAPPTLAAPPRHPADAPAAAMGGGDDAARPILSLLTLTLTLPLTLPLPLPLPLPLTLTLTLPLPLTLTQADPVAPGLVQPGAPLGASRPRARRANPHPSPNPNP